MNRAIKLIATLAIAATLSGCSVLGAIVETTAEIVVGAAEIILQEESKTSRLVPYRALPDNFR